MYGPFGENINHLPFDVPGNGPGANNEKGFTGHIEDTTGLVYMQARYGKRVGDFTRAQKNEAKAENAKLNNGQMSCTDCNKPVENIKSEKGVPTPDNQAQVHHEPAINEGGGKDSKPVVLCPECHKERHKNE